MRLATIVLGFIVVVAIGAYAAPMTGTAKSIGGGSDTVPHCQVLDYDIAALDTISSVNANVECDVTSTYQVSATVTSGPQSGSGQTAASLTANTPASVTVSVSPSVDIASSTYNVDLAVTR